MKRLLACAFVYFLFAATGFSQNDWNQWRGPHRNGIAVSIQTPASYPAELRSVWTVEVGAGYSSPVIEGSRVFQLSRSGDNEVVAAYELKTGKQLWKDSYPVPYNMNPAATRHGKGPKSTPVVSAGKLYTFGINGTLTGYEASSGKILWRNDFKKDFPVTAADFGTAMSPLVDQGAVIVHAGGPGKGAIVAFDGLTGKERWRWADDEPAYASPIIFETGGVRQIVTQSRQFIIGLAPSSGKLLWKMPFNTEYDQNSITPVFTKDLLIFSGLEKPVFAVRLEKQEENWVPKIVWQNETASMYMSTPVIVGDYLYGMTYKRKGQFFCLDTKTGAQQWASEGGEGENTSITVAGKDLWILNDTAELTVARASEKKFEVLKKYAVGKSSTWAHPAITADGILIKDDTSLSFWSFK